MKVRCRRNDEYSKDRLTIGTEYEVKQIHDTAYYLYDDRGCFSLYSKDYFDVEKPSYNMEVAKQLIFGCAAELYHGADGLTKEQVADKLMDILKEMDKM